MVPRHSLQSQAAYSELLEALRLAELEELGARSGSLTRRTVRGNDYWYLRRRVGTRIQETYLGPETPELLASLEEIEATAERAKQAAKSRRQLIGMLRAAGYLTVPRRLGRAVEELVQAGVFRLGGVLIGTHAFATYGALLGVRLAAALAATNDLDIAEDDSITVATTEKVEPGLSEALNRAEKFVSIPGLDPRTPPTGWHTEDHELRVDVVVPMRGADEGRPKVARSLGVHATPLRFLDYLVQETRPAALLSGSGLFVRVPSPERFALHKLLIADRRGTGFADKARKDRAQAATLLEVLLEDEPAALRDAWQDLHDRGAGWRRSVEASGQRLSAELWEELQRCCVRASE